MTKQFVFQTNLFLNKKHNPVKINLNLHKKLEMI